MGNTINRSSPSWITANNVILFLAWVALLSSGTLADLQLPHLTGNHWLMTDRRSSVWVVDWNSEKSFVVNFMGFLVLVLFVSFPPSKSLHRYFGNGIPGHEVINKPIPCSRCFNTLRGVNLYLPMGLTVNEVTDRWTVKGMRWRVGRDSFLSVTNDLPCRQITLITVHLVGSRIIYCGT